MALYLTGGPSGAGKDTLLLKARESLKGSGDDRVIFATRHTTRAADAITDIEKSVTAEEFAETKNAGGFALSWEAHDTSYGIPISIVDELKAGRRVVCNVSRTVIEEAQTNFGAFAEIYFLNITASEGTLLERLTSRARESSEEIAKRIKRAKELEPQGPHVIHIMNEATVDEGVALVVAALKGEMKFNLWLVPPSGPSFDRANSLIARFSEKTTMKPFSPHITLSPGFVTSQQKAVKLMAEVAAAVPPLPVHFTEVVHRSIYFQSVVVLAELTEALRNANDVAKRIVGGDKPFEPHLSLLYGDHPEDLRGAIAQEVAPEISELDFLAADVAVMMTSGSSYHCWTEVSRCPLGGACL